MMDDEIIIGIEHPDNEMPKNKKKKATKKVASKKTKNKDKRNKPKRKQENKSKKPLIIMLILLFFISGFVFLLFSTLFKIQKVEIINNSRVSNEEIEALGNFDSYRNIFWATNLKVSKDLEQNPYIEDVKIHKRFPNILVVEVKERIPRYMLQIADSYAYINNQGYLLEVSTENIRLPIILGFKTDLSNAAARPKARYRRLKKNGYNYKNF